MTSKLKDAWELFNGWKTWAVGAATVAVAFYDDPTVQTFLRDNAPDVLAATAGVFMGLRLLSTGPIGFLKFLKNKA